MQTKEERKAYLHNFHVQWTLKLRQEVINHYGGKCACCGETHIEFLEIDHIDGGGKQHREKLNFHNLAFWLKANKYPKGFQILCANCHKAKSWNRVCPHQLNHTSE